MHCVNYIYPLLGENGILAWLPAEMLLDLILRAVGNFSSITLQIKEEEL